MSPEQDSVTTAFVVIGVSLAVYHHWPSQLASWVRKAPTKPSAGDVKDKLIPVGSLNDYQAAIIAYGIMCVAAATDAAPVATAISWGMAMVMAFGAVTELTKEFPSIFKPGAGQGAQGAQGGAQGGQAAQ